MDATEPTSPPRRSLGTADDLAYVTALLAPLLHEAPVGALLLETTRAGDQARGHLMHRLEQIVPDGSARQLAAAGLRGSLTRMRDRQRPLDERYKPALAAWQASVGPDGVARQPPPERALTRLARQPFARLVVEGMEACLGKRADAAERRQDKKRARREPVGVPTGHDPDPDTRVAPPAVLLSAPQVASPARSGHAPASLAEVLAAAPPGSLAGVTPAADGRDAERWRRMYHEALQELVSSRQQLATLHATQANTTARLAELAADYAALARDAQQVQRERDLLLAERQGSTWSWRHS